MVIIIRIQILKTAIHEVITTSTFKPSVMPGPRNDFDDVRLALSKLDLKTRGTPTLQVQKTKSSTYQESTR